MTTQTPQTVDPTPVEKSEKKDSIVLKKKHLLILLLILVLLLGSCTGFLYWAGKNNKDIPYNPFALAPTPTVRPTFAVPDIDPDAGDLINATPPPRGNSAIPNGIAIPGYPWVAVKARSKQVNVALYNPEGNNCYFIFDVILKSTGETLYSSRMVPPNQSINGFTMTRGLPKGNHAVIIRISTFQLDTLAPQNSANVETVFKCT